MPHRTSLRDAGPQPGAEQVERDHHDHHHEDVGHHDVELELLNGLGEVKADAAGADDAEDEGVAYVHIDAVQEQAGELRDHRGQHDLRGRLGRGGAGRAKRFDRSLVGLFHRCVIRTRGPGCAMLCCVDVNELQHALGGVVLESAYLERTLRTAFSALIGSKYAAVVDGRLTASALIEDCERLTKYHTAIPAPAKDAVLVALRVCHEANRQRNRVIHDTWATRPGNVLITLQGGRTSHEVKVTVQTLAEVRQLGDQVASAADSLRAAMSAALGSGWVLVEDQLRQELGRNITAGPSA